MKADLGNIGKRVLIMDGAMGTMLQKLGLNPGHAPDLWNIENPEAIALVHRQYFEAGSQVLTTNTFGCTRPRLKEYNAEKNLSDIVLRACDILRNVIKDNALIAGDIGPLGLMVEPLGELLFETAVELFSEQIHALVKGGVDIILIETMFDIQEAKAAIVAAKDVAPTLPIFVSLTYGQKGVLDTGTSPEVAGSIVEGFNVDAFGINCSLGPNEMMPVVESLVDNSSLPIMVQPNAGLPVFKDGRTIYNLSDEEVASYATYFVEKGVSVIGGCCGTTPGYIKRLSTLAKDKVCIQRKPKSYTTLASRSELVKLGSNLPFVLIGEKINPTGKKAFQEELREKSYKSAIKLALSQAKAGVNALDLNVGVPLADESELMRNVIISVGQVVELPLIIDSSFVNALEAGLRVYPGKALINSVNGEEERLSDILPLAKRFGSSVIALLSEDSIPETARARLKVLEKILKYADLIGFNINNVVVDCLSLTISAMPKASVETLETIHLVKKEFGLPTTLGLSNVSFGLPLRRVINKYFLAMAISNGLDSAILDPYDDGVHEAIHTASIFSDRDPGCQRFIDYGQRISTESLGSAKGLQSSKKNGLTNTSELIYNAVFEGDRERIADYVGKGLSDGLGALHILTDIMTPSIRKLGDMFGKGKKFLPHLIMAADAMKKGVVVLEPILKKNREHKRKGLVIFATVKGDIHDIGKNLCGMMLENFGFDVIDLGRNVPNELILKTAIEKKADIIALSALMTTTMIQMKLIQDEIDKANMSFKVMVGGAAVTKRFAEEIGVDGYGKDVSEVVSLAESLIESSDEKVYP